MGQQIMPIDPKMVKWDDQPTTESSTAKIDPKMVKWESPQDEDPSSFKNSMMSALSSGGLGAIPALMTEQGRANIGNSLAGLVRGAGSIGSTILAPYDMYQDWKNGDRKPSLSDQITGNKPISRNDERRAAIDSGLQSMGANPESSQYKGGKLVAEMAGTAGAGGAIAKGLGLAVPAINSTQLGSRVLQAIGSNGMTTGAGTITPALTGLGSKAADLGIRTLGGATSGAAQTALIDPEHAGMGAAIGAAMPSLIGLGGYGIKVLGALAKPLTEQGQNDIAGAIINKFGKGSNTNIDASQIIKGSNPTLAEATGNAGIARLQSGIRDVSPNPFVERERLNALARNNAFDEISGDAGKLDFFKSSREQAANDLYGDALSATPEPLTPYLKGQITQLMKRPSIHNARRDAQDLAIERGEKPLQEGSLPALHDMKTIIDDKISAAVQQNQGGQVKALSNTRDKLLGVMEKLSPNYREARATYAEMSTPINEMEALLGLNMRDQVGNITLSKSQNALNNLNKLRDASGINPAKSISEDKMSMLGNIRDDLLRQNYLNAGKSTGSTTYQNLSTDSILGSLMPGSLEKQTKNLAGTWSGQFGKLFYSNADDKIKGLLQDAMLNPTLAQSMMRQNLQPPTRGLLGNMADQSIPFAYKTAPYLFNN